MLKVFSKLTTHLLEVGDVVFLLSKNDLQQSTFIVEKFPESPNTVCGIICVTEYCVLTDELIVCEPQEACFNFADHDYNEERVYMVYSARLGVVTPFRKHSSVFLGSI
jgi:hypothetical protein